LAFYKDYTEMPGQQNIKKSNMTDVKGERITFFRNASKYLPVATE